MLTIVLKFNFKLFIIHSTVYKIFNLFSAAHCFWNPYLNKFFDKTLFMVGVGKTYRLIETKEATQSQFFNVSDLIVDQQ